VIGGYLLTIREVYKAASKYNPNPGRIQLHPVEDVNRVIKEGGDPKLWPHRLQAISAVRPDGKRGLMFIFPTVWSSDQVDPSFKYTEEESATANLRAAARRLAMPDELFANFVTLIHPDFIL
jgi:hypothetical protein